MNALDTNVLVRLVTDDDDEMRGKAVRLIENTYRARAVLIIPIPALLETLWVLKTRYGFSRSRILDAIDRLLLVQGLRFEASVRVRELVRLGRSTSTELADILLGLCARDLGCESMLTFDKKASKSPLFERIP